MSAAFLLMQAAIAGPLYIGFEKLAIELPELLVSARAFAQQFQVGFFDKQCRTLTVDGETELIIGSVFVGPFGIFTAAVRFAADIPLSADASRQDRAERRQGIFNALDACEVIGHRHLLPIAV
jgi:hypothetical protein